MADLPKIALQRLARVEAGAHPDANLLSALSENSLHGEAREPVLRHIAHCATCREIVFLSAPELAAAHPALSPSSSRWLSWPALRWSAALVAVVVVAAAVGLHRRSNSTGSYDVRATDTIAPAENVAAPPVEAKQAQNELAKSTNAPLSPPADNATDASLDHLKKQSLPAAAPSLQKETQSRAPEADGKNRRDQSNDVEVTAASAPPVYEQEIPARAKDAATQASSGAAAKSNLSEFQPRPATILPTTAPRWILTDGSLQRSLDYGKTWQTMPVAGQATFRALAANGANIWVGGAKGALYHSSDSGQSWAQIQPSFAGQILIDDIIGVEFPDAQHGRLTTALKATWTTEDGGQSWQKQ